jgi:hypothetical protein
MSLSAVNLGTLAHTPTQTDSLCNLLGPHPVCVGHLWCVERRRRHSSQSRDSEEHQRSPSNAGLGRIPAPSGRRPPVYRPRAPSGRRPQVRARCGAGRAPAVSRRDERGAACPVRLRARLFHNTSLMYCRALRIRTQHQGCVS